MRGVIYEHGAAAEADAARALWKRGDDVITMFEWVLARDPTAGLPYGSSQTLRYVVFPGAKSVGMPSVDCLFNSTPERAVIVELVFY